MSCAFQRSPRSLSRIFFSWEKGCFLALRKIGRPACKLTIRCTTTNPQLMEVEFGPSLKRNVGPMSTFYAVIRLAMHRTAQP